MSCRVRFRFLAKLFSFPIFHHRRGLRFTKRLNENRREGRENKKFSHHKNEVKEVYWYLLFDFNIFGHSLRSQSQFGNFQFCSIFLDILLKQPQLNIFRQFRYLFFYKIFDSNERWIKLVSLNSAIYS